MLRMRASTLAFVINFSKMRLAVKEVNLGEGIKIFQVFSARLIKFKAIPAPKLPNLAAVERINNGTRLCE